MANPGLSLTNTNIDYTSLLKKKKKLGLLDNKDEKNAKFSSNDILNDTGNPVINNSPYSGGIGGGGSSINKDMTSSSKNDLINLSTGVPEVDNAFALEYKKELDNINLQKKYLIGSTIGQGLLNLTNIAQANKQMPTSAMYAPIPNVEYPSVVAPGIADINTVVGRYRSGARRIGAERGYNPIDLMRGVEANVLNTELSSRAKLAETDIANQQAEAIANAEINKSNITNKYAADIAAQERRDTIAANRSALYSKGLTNIGALGANLAEGLISLGKGKSNTELGRTIINQYINADNEEAKLNALNNWVASGLGTVDDFKTQVIKTTNIPLTNAEIK
jgi:hypothetical protein